MKNHSIKEVRALMYHLALESVNVLKLYCDDRYKEHIKRKDELCGIFFWSLAMLELVFAIPVLATLIIPILSATAVGVCLDISIILFIIAGLVHITGIAIYRIIFNILPKKRIKSTN